MEKKTIKEIQMENNDNLSCLQAIGATCNELLHSRGYLTTDEVYSLLRRPESEDETHIVFVCK